MNPLLNEVIRLWNIAEPKVPFSDLVNDCLANGAVIVKPWFVLIAKEMWTDGKRVENREDKNCWFVFAASQKNLTVFHFMKEAIYRKEYVAFYRRKKLHIYKWKSLEEKLK